MSQTISASRKGLLAETFKILLDKFVATYYTMFVATKKRGELVSAMEKGTRLTDNPKDYMLRVRLDSGLLEKLDSVCEKEKKSRSEVVRKGINEQYENMEK